MGACDSNNNKPNYYKVPGIQHIQAEGNPETHSYKFNFTEKNNFSKQKFNLKFIFFNFKVKYCISHKPSKDSIYITQIIIGEKKFPLAINQGQSPSIPNPDDIPNGYVEEKEYTIEELENTYLLINIYEILEDISDSLKDLENEIPEIYKQKCKYNSFFRISLLSFLFKSIKCDFAMMGTNQLSTKTRISFFCFIDHKEKIAIKAKALNNQYDYKNLVFRLNDKMIYCSTKQSDKYFIIITPPLTMFELQRGDLFLETTENCNYYHYLSLNDLKGEIIRQIGFNILNEENNFNINLHKPVNINDINDPLNQNKIKNDSLTNDGSLKTKNPKQYAQYNQMMYQCQYQNKRASLCFQNLPFIAQFSNSYFTEYGNVHSTGMLNLINNDQELHNYRKSKSISSDNFYEKLNRYYTELSKPNYDLNVLNDIQVLLMRSINNDRFMFIYPSMDHLNQMVILFIMLGLKIIETIKNTTEELNIIILTKLINILMRREELDNGVLYECMNKYKGTANDPQKYYNQLIIELLYLYQLLLSNKLSSSEHDATLIELFSRLYFQKSIFRKIILNTLCRQNIIFTNNELLTQNNIYLYDIINDEKLNRYLNKDTQKLIRNFQNNRDYFNNSNFDNYRLVKKILSFINDININQYPFDFTLFNDNVNILDIMERDISLLKSEKYTLSNDFYESLMLLSNSIVSISNINNALIKNTNGHNANAVYTLFIYFKSLFDYYSSSSNCKLIMDYTVFESACQLLAQNEDSLSLPRLFWLYYCCSETMLSPNIKWFIVNIVNKYFDKFAFHWSFTIRQVFFKLSLFILYDKLQYEEGELFRKDKLFLFINKNINNPNNVYTKEAYKDFDTIYKEYKDWLGTKKDNESDGYPIFFLPAPLANNGVID